MIELDQTSYERILNFMSGSSISQWDSHAVGATSISQRCNEMRRNPKKYEKYLKGRRIGARPRESERAKWVEYYLIIGRVI